MLIGSDSYYVFVVSFSEVSARVSVRKLPSLPDRDMTTAVWCVLPDVFAKMMTALADGGQLRDQRERDDSGVQTQTRLQTREASFSLNHETPVKWPVVPLTAVDDRSPHSNDEP